MAKKKVTNTSIIENTDVEEKQDDITKILIISDPEEKTPYSIKNAILKFSADIDDDKFVVRGVIESDNFIDNTELKSISSWRYKLSNIKINRFEFETNSMRILTYFSAENFEVVV